MASTTSAEQTYLSLVQKIIVSLDELKTAWRLLLSGDDRPHGFPTAAGKIPWPKEYFRVDPESKSIRVKGPSTGEHIAEAVSKAVNEAFQAVIDVLIELKMFSILCRHSVEIYQVPGAPGVTIHERLATAPLGTTGRTSYLIAYTRNADGSIGGVWVSRRGKKVLSPNKLDVTAAGGVPAGRTPWQYIFNEAEEEASLSKEVVQQAEEIDPMMYVTRYQGLIYSCIMHGFDLDLSGKKTTPSPGDPDEVAELTLMTVDEIKEALFKDDFTSGASLGMIDFFRRRHIIIGNEADRLQELLHSPLPVPISPQEKREET